MAHLLKYLEGISRVMVANGTYLMLSCLDESFVSKYLERVEVYSNRPNLDIHAPK